MTTSNWALREQPRQKLFDIGAKNLSDAELLSLLLGAGGKGKSALSLARDLLQQFDGLSGVLSADVRQIAKIPSIGQAKSATLAAMRELGHRQLYADVQDRDVLCSSQATRDYLRARFRYCKTEIFSCIFLTNQHHILRLDEMFQGTVDGAAVYPREVVERCLAYNAAAVILTHKPPIRNRGTQPGRHRHHAQAARSPGNHRRPRARPLHCRRHSRRLSRRAGPDVSPAPHHREPATTTAIPANNIARDMNNRLHPTIKRFSSFSYLPGFVFTTPRSFMIRIKATTSPQHATLPKNKQIDLSNSNHGNCLSFTPVPCYTD